MSHYKKILSKAAKYCSLRERCEHDIKEKMTLWGLDDADREKAITYLIENKYIDDSRYARFFVKDKLKFNKWGRIKINYQLRHKQISSKIIEASFESIDQREYEAILDQVVTAKIKTIGSIKKMSDKAKVIRYAAQKGFTSEEIFSSLSRVEKGKNN